MGHCDHPEHSGEGSLPRWQTNEVVLTINGVGAQVRSYCNDCLAEIMDQLDHLLPRKGPEIEVTAQGETIVKAGQT